MILGRALVKPNIIACFRTFSSTVKKQSTLELYNGTPPWYVRPMGVFSTVQLYSSVLGGTYYTVFSNAAAASTAAATSAAVISFSCLVYSAVRMQNLKIVTRISAVLKKKTNRVTDLDLTVAGMTGPRGPFRVSPHDIVKYSSSSSSSDNNSILVFGIKDRKNNSNRPPSKLWIDSSQIPSSRVSAVQKLFFNQSKNKT